MERGSGPAEPALCGSVVELSRHEAGGGVRTGPAVPVGLNFGLIDLIVHRNGDSGSPRESGSTNLSSAASSPGSATVAVFRPPPSRRTRPCPSGSSSSSPNALVIVGRDAGTDPNSATPRSPRPGPSPEHRRRPPVDAPAHSGAATTRRTTRPDHRQTPPPSSRAAQPSRAESVTVLSSASGWVRATLQRCVPPGPDGS